MASSVAPASRSARGRLLHADIFRALRGDILACRLAPGCELREGELAARFGVSKSPVRDALSRLAHEELVLVMPRQGYRVAPISLGDVRDMCEYRAVLESACVRIGVAQASDAALGALDRFRRFRGRDHPDGFVGYNRRFHQALAALSGNPRLMRAASSQIDQMERVIRMSVDAMERENPSKLVEEHGAIVDAIQAREARRAVALVARHIAGARDRVCAALRRLAVHE